MTFPKTRKETLEEFLSTLIQRGYGARGRTARPEERIMSRDGPPSFDDHCAYIRAKERRRRIEAYQMTAEPILKKMVDLRSMFTTYTMTVPRGKALSLSEATISPVEINPEFPPEVQQLYSAYEKTLKELQAMYLGEVKYP